MKKKIKVLISACLLGDNVKYSGGNNLTPELVILLEKYNVDIVKVYDKAGNLIADTTYTKEHEIRQIF